MIKQPPLSPEKAKQELLKLRQSIDNIDNALIYILAERFCLTQKVGELKATYQLPPSDPQRESEQITRLREMAKSAHLDPNFAEKFLHFIITEVIQHHKAIAKQKIDKKN